MKEQFVTYEIALKLKELDFNEECFGYFNEKKNLILASVSADKKFIPFYYTNLYATKWLGSIFSSKNKKNNICVAPLWQQVIDWFRDEKFINIEIIRFPNINKWGFITTNMNIIPKYLSDEEMIIYNNLVTSPNRYDTYEDVRVAAILQAINIIEDEVRSNLGEVPANS